jgi:hypothetical protein
MRLSRFLIVWLAGACGAFGVPGAAADADSSHDDEQIVKAADIGTTDQALLDFIRRRTLSDSDQNQLQTLIRQLGDDSFEVRERASAALVARGAAAEPFLLEAKKSSDIEVVRRAEECLRLIKRGMSAAVPAAVVRLLGKRKPAGAAEVLLTYLPHADSEAVADEVCKALAVLAVRDGKPEPALRKALIDQAPVRRAAAAEALCRSGAAEVLADVRKLLRDADPGVQLRVAQALAAAKDREAIPVLIELLGKLPRERAWTAEEMLLRLAGDGAPKVALGQANGEKCREAWDAWWKDHGAQADLAKITQAPTLLGYTLIVLLDVGRALELDKENKPRWQIDGLQFPLDIQLLAGNRVLVAEHGANRITERDLKGQILWEKDIESPLVAQRLPNGNTFIATNSQLVEITMAGKEVFTYTPPGFDMIMKAQKLRNGDIGLVLQGNRFMRLDSTGREIKSFPVNVSTSGGRIDVLPNGHVLVPEHRGNRLVEYNGDGKQVWEATVEQPVAAVRLPNGNTLVTSMSERRAIELDPKGKEVWSYRADTRVTRAFRR